MLNRFNRWVTVLLAFGIVLLLTLLPGPVHARVFAEAPLAGGATIVLHDEPGPCVGGAMLAQFISAAGEITPGCWVKRPGHVAIVFLDGDVGAVPEAALQKPKTS